MHCFNNQETFGSELKARLPVFTRVYTFKLNHISYTYDDETRHIQSYKSINKSFKWKISF